MKLKAALAVAEEDLVNGSTKAKKKGKGKVGILVSSDPLIDDEVVGSVAATVTPGGYQRTGEKGESDSEKVVRELSNSEAAHLFTALRKAANHPLLLRVRYQDEEVMSKIAGIAYSRGRFGNQCDYQRVRDEIDNFSDFDLHQLCLEYPETLGHLQLDAEVLYDSQKMQKLKTMLPQLVVRGKATFHIAAFSYRPRCSFRYSVMSTYACITLFSVTLLLFDPLYSVVCFLNSSVISPPHHLPFPLLFISGFTLPFTRRMAIAS